MSIIRWRKNESSLPSFSSFFQDFWGDETFGRSGGSVAMPAVNILEQDHQFEIELAAPGLKKEDFNVNLDNNVLTISAEQKKSEASEDKLITRREFSYSAFSRSFTLPDTIEEEQIDANYEDGVLKLFLPKKETAQKKASRDIIIK